MKKKINNMKINYRKSDYALFFLFSLCFLILYMKDIRCLNQCIVLNDEFGYWSIAASIAGKEWRSLIANTPYYSYGYSFLLVPLFYLGMPMYRVYKMAVLLNAGMAFCSFLISIYCGKRLFPQISSKVVVICCFLVACYSNNIIQAQVAWTETLLYFLFWLATLLLILIKQRPTVLRLEIFVFILGYMFMVHQRTLGIVIAGVIAVVALTLSGENRKKALLAIVTICVLLGIQVLIKQDIKSWLWDTSALGIMNDFSGQISMLSSLFSISGIRGIFFGSLGRIFYFLISGGIVWTYGMWFICSNIVKNSKRKEKFKLDINKDAILYIFILVSFVLSVVIGLTSVLNGFSRCDSVVYGRYIENTIGPVLLFGCLFLYQKGVTNRALLYQILSVILTGGATLYILALISNNQFNDICSVGLGLFFSDGQKIIPIYKAVIYAILQVSIIYLFSKLKQKKIKYILIYGFILCGWLWSARYVFDHTIAFMQETKTSNNESLVELLKATELDEIYYVIDENYDCYCTNIKYVQFLVPDIRIEVIEGKEVESLEEDCVWICEKGSDESSILIEDACVLKETPEVYVCTSMKSAVREILYEKDLLQAEEIDLSYYCSELWDDDYEEEYRSNGKAGNMIDDMEIDLSEGSYHVDFNLSILKFVDKENIGKCTVTSQGKIIAEVPIVSGTKKRTTFGIDFSCMDTKNISFNVEVSKGTIIRINSISYSKTKNEYLVGADRKEDFDEMIDIVKEITSYPVLYVSNHKNITFDKSYVLDNYSDLVIECKMNDELEWSKTGESYILLERTGADIFEYLDEFECVRQNGSFILLINKKSVQYSNLLNQGWEFWSKTGAINVNALKMNEDGTVPSDNAVQLEQGQYTFIAETGNSEGYLTLDFGSGIKKYLFGKNLLDIQEEFSVGVQSRTIVYTLNKKIADNRPVNIYIKKTDDAACLDLANVITEEEIYSGDTDSLILKEGDTEIPLGLDLNMGNYQFVVKVENKSDVEGELGIFEVTRDTGTTDVLWQEIPIIFEENEKHTSLDIMIKVDKAGMKNIKFKIGLNKGEISVNAIKYQKLSGEK